MPDYRLYFLDPDSGRIDGYEDISSAADDIAICLANSRALSGPAELWLGSRKVGSFAAPALLQPMAVGWQ